MTIDLNTIKECMAENDVDAQSAGEMANIFNAVSAVLMQRSADLYAEDEDGELKYKAQRLEDMAWELNNMADEIGDMTA